MALYQFLILCFFAVYAFWYIGQKIEYAGAEAAIPKQTGPSVDAHARQVAQIAATLIGAAMNNPQYVARMQTLRADLQRARDIKHENHQSEKREERKRAEEAEKLLSRTILETDIFGHGYQPYIDLAFEIYRSAYKLQRLETTFSQIDSDLAMSSKDREIADSIVRSQLVRELARP
jgi:hypothetical protein